MNESVVEDENIKIWIKGKVMCGEYKVADVTRDKAQAMIATRLKVCNGTPFPFFADVTRVKSIDREAREEFSKGDGIAMMPACALLIKSPVNQILGNFFMFVNKPLIPTRLFTSQQDAFEWLEKFK
jgi:hypothetical protein